MSESPTPREDLLSIFQDIAERWDAGIKAGWLLAQLEDRIAEYDPRITRIIRALDATALAEAEARGYARGLEEGARTADSYARVRIEPHAGVLRTFAMTLRSLATTPAETQKSETGESAR